MTPVETLQGMRDLLAGPKRWTQGARAKNALGEDTNPIGEDAVCWCIVGAYQRIATKEVRQDIYEDFRADEAGQYLQREAFRLSDLKNPWSFNDLHTHPEVIALIDAALINAKKDANVL